MVDTMKLDLAHFSMQFSDTKNQKKYDAKKIFNQGYDAITGTETGEAPTRRALRVQAHNNGYSFFVERSNWVAIRRALILPGTYRKGHRAFVDSEDVVGPGHDLHVTWAGCAIKDVGRVSFMSSHYATKGVPGGRGGRGVNVEDNRKLARGIGNLAKRLGAGRDVVFYGGDQNIVDKDHDTFFGEDLTSAWDELKKYQNTGHGNIDVIASYDKDRRVRAKYIRALNDDKMFLHTDHYAVEAGFTIKLLK